MDSKVSSTIKKVLIVFGIVLVAYNVVLFSCVGFANHDASFWISYVFMMIAFFSIAVTGFFVNVKTPQTKDWIFGFPPVKHNVIYAVIELFLSVLFMMLDVVACPWFIALSIQMIAFTIFVVLVVSCFIAQDTITNIQTNVKDSTRFISVLKVNAEMICEKTKDEEVKAAFKELAERIRYSDPISNPALAELENKISFYINEAANASAANDKATALYYCELATTSLIERNKKCKALK